MENPKVRKILDSYPEEIKEKLLYLRSIILQTAHEPDIMRIEETIRWGEISYISKWGSTLRIGWSSKKPYQYAIYFQCTSKLVSTFKMVYGDIFNYEKNRAIIFKLNQSIPRKELKECITATLMYHKVKHKMLLGLG